MMFKPGAYVKVNRPDGAICKVQTYFEGSGFYALKHEGQDKYIHESELIAYEPEKPLRVQPTFHVSLSEWLNSGSPKARMRKADQER